MKIGNFFLRELDQSHYEKIKQIGIDNAYPIGFGNIIRWGKGDFTVDKWVFTSFPAYGAFNHTWSYDLAFVHIIGSNGIKIRNARLLINNAVAASDDHESTADDPRVNNICTIIC